MLFQAFKGSWMVHRILDSHPHGTAWHLSGHLEGLDALTHHQGAYGFRKRMHLSGVFPSYRTLLHKESPPFSKVSLPHPIPPSSRRIKEDLDVGTSFIGSALQRRCWKRTQTSNLYAFLGTCQ